MPAYDFIIVGAGSAGCVLANRLSADPSIQVLLLEAGGRNMSLNIIVPARILSVIGKPSVHSYFRFSEPQPHMDGRTTFWPSGKGWGGTSAINGMAYMRGQREDYDGWASLGLPEWSYEHVLPYFKRAESNERGASVWHGDSGPLHVSDSAVALPLSDVFIAAGLAAGYRRTEDFNGLDAEGFGRVQQTIRGRWRWSTSSAYLRPVIRRRNLTVMNHCTVRRVLTRGTRAIGVEYLRGRDIITANCREEIVLTAGTVATPQLLLLSGIGDPARLTALGIPVVADRKDVGANLQDHVGVQLLQLCSKPVTLYDQIRGWGMLKAGLRYAFAGTGPAGGIGVDTYAAIRSTPAEKTPDIHVAFVNALVESLQIRRHGFSLNMWHLRPDSRGSISLRSANPYDDPIIQPNYLSESKERLALREALRAMRHVVAQQPFESYRGAELEPGAAIVSDDGIDAFIRQRATGLWHPTSSARMGTDVDAVVDGRLRVNGIDNLRIADASVMPNVPSGNTNAPVIMIAEKASDMILRRPALPRVESSVSDGSPA